MRYRDVVITLLESPPIAGHRLRIRKDNSDRHDFTVSANRTLYHAISKAGLCFGTNSETVLKDAKYLIDRMLGPLGFFQ